MSVSLVSVLVGQPVLLCVALLWYVAVFVSGGFWVPYPVVWLNLGRNWRNGSTDREIHHKGKSPMWTRVSFHYILDTARVNASTVFALNFDLSATDVNAFEIRWSLAESLGLTLARQRSTVGLSSKTQLKLSFLVGNQQTEQASPEASDEPTPRKKQRCHSCLQELVGKQSYKEEKSRLTKIKSTCRSAASPPAASTLSQFVWIVRINDCLPAAESCHLPALLWSKSKSVIINGPVLLCKYCSYL